MGDRQVFISLCSGACQFLLCRLLYVLSIRDRQSEQRLLAPCPWLPSLCAIINRGSCVKIYHEWQDSTMVQRGDGEDIRLSKIQDPTLLSLEDQVSANIHSAFIFAPMQCEHLKRRRVIVCVTSSNNRQQYRTSSDVEPIGNKSLIATRTEPGITHREQDGLLSRGYDSKNEDQKICLL